MAVTSLFAEAQDEGDASRPPFVGGRGGASVGSQQEQDPHGI